MPPAEAPPAPEAALDGVADAVVEECESTNDLARRLAERGVPAGTWVSARRQTRGRGRSGRSWVSPPGEQAVFLSMVARLSARGAGPGSGPAPWTWVPLLAAVAAARACEPFAGGRRLEIKWPNDLWLDRAKLGGILCEGALQSGFIVIGIGINCGDAPRGLDQPAAALECGPDPVRERLVAELRAALARLDAEGPAWIAPEFERRSALRPGDEVRWGPPGAQRSGTVLGLGGNGELRVLEPRAQEETRILAEDVSLLRPGGVGPGGRAR